jgi:hypothetical protein
MKLDWRTALGWRVKYNPAIAPPLRGNMPKPYLTTQDRGFWFEAGRQGTERIRLLDSIDFWKEDGKEKM